MDSTFPRRYEYEELDELPGSPSFRHLYFPGSSTTSGSDGVLVKVQPAVADPWIGTFAFDHGLRKGLSRVFTTPNPDVICVVARGAGYFVSVDAPDKWWPVRATPVRDVRQIPARGVIVFADFTDLIAYGESGVRWTTDWPASDDVQITEVADTEIRGTYWVAAVNQVVVFVVDAETGAHQG